MNRWCACCCREEESDVRQVPTIIAPTRTYITEMEASTSLSLFLFLFCQYFKYISAYLLLP
jgi:hypothetical protein